MPQTTKISLEDLKQFVADHNLPDGKKLGEIIDFSNRKPLLIAGELANPCRLADMGAPDLPIIPIRLENICRTWADSLDPREITPGIHHVTIARSPGWWEISYITLIELKDMKKLVNWLDGNTPNTWAPKRLNEGIIRLENDLGLSTPSMEDISWDGEIESVNTQIPNPNGPIIDLASVIVPIHTRSGCYNSRGRIIRCAHIMQNDFHENYFRRGSSFKWNQLLDVI